MNAQPPESSDELSVYEGYAAWASTYDEDGNPLIPLEGPAVLELLGPIDGRTILDVGCGTGRHAIALAGLGARVFALDQNEAMIARAKVKANASDVAWIRHALPDRFPFPDQSVDGVVMGLVVEHVEDLHAVLVDLRRVAQKGGRCVMSMLHPDRTEEGQRARFIDVKTGLRRPITTIHRSKDNYRRIAAQAGWTFCQERDLIVPQTLVQQHPRAARYVGKPLGWVASWQS